MEGMTLSAARPEPDESISATQRTYGELRGKILMGEIAPGSRLKVEALKRLLGTGASPVREALSLLTSDHLVERIDQKGFRVANVSEAQFRELLALRCELEGYALRSGLPRADESWEERLVLSHHHLSRTPRDGAELFEQRHKAFHMALIDACASPILIRFCGQLYDLNIRYRNLAGSALTYEKRDIAAEHVEIMDAAIARDADRASELLGLHYSRTGEFLASSFTKMEYRGATRQAGVSVRSKATRL